MNDVERAIQQAIAHAHDHYEQYLEGFKALLRIPSVSTDPAHTADVQHAAEWLVMEMSRIGLTNCQAIASEGHPVVYGEWLAAGADKPTILVYAHYDVQPVDPLDLWESPPFEPTVRDGRLYARGVIDDKCGAFINLKAFESIFETQGKLPVNVKIFFEGEEESGSPSMEPFVIAQKELLAADVLLISDGGSLPEQPLTITSVRGIVDAQVRVTGPQTDLHSGTFGGVVHNPAHLVGKMIAALHDEEGWVQIPGFYDDVLPLEPHEKERLPEQEKALIPRHQEQAGVKAFWGPADYSYLERSTALPTCDVNGLTSGYQGPGMKTIIPSTASFKASMRLVPNQDPHDIARKFETFIKSFATETLDIEVAMGGMSRGVQLLSQGPVVEAISKAFEAVWGKRPLLYRQGGSVPIIGTFHHELQMPITTLGYGVGANGHAPNEYYVLDYFQKNIDTAIHFYNYLGEVAQDEI